MIQAGDSEKESWDAEVPLNQMESKRMRITPSAAALAFLTNPELTALRKKNVAFVTQPIPPSNVIYRYKKARNSLNGEAIFCMPEQG
jgi:hypothetical protein